MILAGNCALESMGFKTFWFWRWERRCIEPEQRYILQVLEKQMVG